MEITTKEITTIKSKTTKAIAEVNSMIVDSKESNENANSIVNKIRTFKKFLIAMRKEKIEPLKEEIKSIKDQFDPLEDEIKKAEDIIMGKMLIYSQAEREKIRIEEARIAARVEKETMKPETAVKKMEVIQEKEPEKTVKSDAGSSTIRVIKKVRIIKGKEHLIPREYLKIDEPAVRMAVLAGIDVPGAEMYEEETMALRQG